MSLYTRARSKANEIAPDVLDPTRKELAIAAVDADESRSPGAP